MGTLRSGARASMPAKEIQEAREKLNALRHESESLEKFLHGVANELSTKATTFYKDVIKDDRVSKVIYTLQVHETYMTKEQLERGGVDVDNIQPPIVTVEEKDDIYRMMIVHYERTKYFAEDRDAMAREDFGEFKAGNSISKNIAGLALPIQDASEAGVFAAKVQVMRDMIKHFVLSGMSAIEAETDKQVRRKAATEAVDLNQKIKEVDEIFDEIIEKK